MHLTHLQSGHDLHLQAPFSNLRLLIADFGAAQQLLSKAIKTLPPKRLMRLSLPPHLLIQPMECLAGGLSQMEERILMELGLGSGAHKVCVHVGDELDSTDVYARLSS